MKDLTKGNTRKVILQFAIPIFIGSIFQILYSLADMRIVGEILGKEAQAAVTATSTLNDLIVGFLIGLTNGFAVTIAREFGAGQMQQVRKNIGGGIVLGSIISIFLTIASMIFVEPLLVLLNMKGSLMEEGLRYIRVVLMGMSAAFIYNTCASILRAVGDTVAPLIFLIIAVVINIVLDYVLIKTTPLGVAGAAYATVIAQIIASILCIIYILKKYPVLCPKKQDLKIKLELAKNLLSAGVSMGLMHSLVLIGTVALQGAINTFDTNIIVAHGGARKVTEMLMLPFSVLGMTIATYCSQNLGAKQYDRIKRGIIDVTASMGLWCIVTVIISYTASPILIKIITGRMEAEIINTATLYLRINSSLYFVTAMIFAFRNALQGLGDYKTPLVSSGIELVMKVVIALILVPIMGYMGVIICEPVIWCVMVIPLIIKIISRPEFKTCVQV